jgi:peptidoglycan/xylan/chitin deacetylase (PgdA/CDA1 family)
VEPSGRSEGRWGPDARLAAVSVTFDNLGEAAERQRGSWPEEKPLGRHPSVTGALPTILSMLDELGLEATFFVEGVNAQTYPHAISAIAEAGHEVGYHAWCHEFWGGLERDEERELLDRGASSMRELGVEVRGFRPPGGALTDASPDLLREFGFDHASPAGQRAGLSDGLALVPFAWRLVDAYFYMPVLSLMFLRTDTHGGVRDAAGALKATIMRAGMRRAFGKELRACGERGEHACLVFHPFLSLGQGRLATLRAVLEDVSSMVRAGDWWCAPTGAVAGWMLENRDDFAAPR